MSEVTGVHTQTIPLDDEGGLAVEGTATPGSINIQLTFMGHRQGQLSMRWEEGEGRRGESAMGESRASW